MAASDGGRVGRRRGEAAATPAPTLRDPLADAVRRALGPEVASLLPPADGAGIAAGVALRRRRRHRRRWIAVAVVVALGLAAASWACTGGRATFGTASTILGT
jgi:hypothetical protein